MDIVVSIVGNRIILSVNGQQVFDVTDPDPLGFGGVGILTAWNSTTSRFDNFKVTKIDGKQINPNNGNAYQQFDAPLSWNDAKSACEGLGGHLATITDQTENDWVSSNMWTGVDYVWLGGTDQEQEGEWRWITGEPWSYTDWYPNEPNNSGNEDHLMMRERYISGSWNDDSGYKAFPYVCEWENDSDHDGISDNQDNCPAVANPDQLNTDGDAQGDACDTDDDNDAVLDSADNCPIAANADQADNDGDSFGDICDDDDDNDTVLDSADNCKLTANQDQADADADGQGDVCDGDQDGDGVANAADNCPSAANADQADNDGDAQGDACDADDDNDTVLDAADNCPADANADQKDLDGDNIGDACDIDIDGDGVNNDSDNCKLTVNAAQEDTDSDGSGDACDSDDDNDTVLDTADNCPLIVNADQADADHDGQGDVCDGDLDGDGIANNTDNCPNVANGSQADFDHDGQGDACDDDVDGDGVANSGDACGFTELNAAVNPAEGCSIAQLCPCEGPRGVTGLWKNHGQYVSCTAKSAESFVGLNLITEAEKDAAVSAAAESDCGAKK
ncbi:MAG: thrombospondin type 3 repeat-containing protein [Candidatus Electronema sp. V4]|uniref:thrombospondin type 3 repeat-containing protein n=1 Tax=Candidatus Electronema sp. V4 TaxID=3454756 RepID=UPI00405572FA